MNHYLELNWPFLVGSLLSLLFLLLSLRYLKRCRLVSDLPTSKCHGVFLGLTEIKGTAECASPLFSYLAGIDCVLYRWSVEEHWSRTVVEHYTDSKGRTRTRTRHESGWSTVDSGGETMPFFVRDDTGIILVRPEGADIEPVTVFDETCGRSDPLYYGKGPSHAVMNSDHRRRFSEQAIPLHEELYVMGNAREREDVIAAEIAQSPDAPMFLITTHTEKEVGRRLAWGRWIFFILGLFATLGGAFANAKMNNPDYLVQPLTMVWPGIIYLCLAAIAWLWIVYNGLIEHRQRVMQGRSQLEVQFKRRHDLIPNLVAVVAAYKEYERETMEMVALLRGQMREGAKKEGIAPQLIALAEAYPNLKASESFLALHKSLVDTENRISLAAAYYNDIATSYNTRLQVVPDRYVARLARLQPMELIEVEAFERDPRAVQLEYAAA